MALLYELKLLGIAYETEKSHPFAHNNTQKDRDLRMDVVIPLGGLYRAETAAGRRLNDEEVHDLPPGSRKEIVTSKDKALLLDVTVASVHATTNMRHLPPSFTTPGVALCNAGSTKWVKYGHKYDARHYQFRTFAMESHGRFSMQTDSVLNLIAGHAVGGRGGGAKEVKAYRRGMDRRISIAPSARVSSYAASLQEGGDDFGDLE
jgi:hypothetical protein